MENEKKEEVLTEVKTEGTETTKKSKYTAFIIEGVIAIIAVGIIIFAVARGNASKSVSVNTAYGDMPAIGDIAELNNISENEAEAKVQDGSMIKLETKNGGYVYVANYQDEAKFKESVTPSDEDIDMLINQGILANYSDQAPITGRTDVQMNDTVSINYVGTIDGKAFEGGTGSYDLTIGSHSFIDDFEEQLIGAKVGDTVKVNVTFPEAYGVEELNGQDAEFTVTINDLLYTSKVPELTDEIVTEFFSNMGESDITTVEACMKYCNDYITEYNTYNYISDAYFASDVDKDIVISFYNDTIGYYDSMAQNYGTDLKTMLESDGTDIEDLKREITDNAVESALYMTVIQAIADDLNVEVTDDDLLDFVKEQGFDSLENYYSTYGSEYTIKYYTLEKKTIETLKDLYK